VTKTHKPAIPERNIECAGSDCVDDDPRKKCNVELLACGVRNERYCSQQQQYE
jgi:hypothetical protein